MRTRLVAVYIAVPLASGLATSWGQAATVLGAKTPQAVVARMSKGADAGDVAEIVACMDPDSRADATMAMVMGATMMVAFMDMGAGMAGGMADGMGDSGAMKPEDKAKLEKEKAAAAAKAKKAKASLSALLKKYGLPDFLDPSTPKPKSGSGRAMLSKVDQPALVADLNRLMDEIGDKDSKNQSHDAVPAPDDVTDYAIAGDHATAKAGSKTLEFVKVDGRWFIKTPPMGADQ
jgi:hypothetical protein